MIVFRRSTTTEIISFVRYIPRRMRTLRPAQDVGPPTDRSQIRISVVKVATKKVKDKKKYEPSKKMEIGIIRNR